MKNKVNQSTIFERIIPSERNEAKILIGEALVYFRKLQKSGLARDVSEFNFRLALDELIENAISHGNSYDPGKKISVTIKATNKNLNMTVKDEGSGFQPETAPERSLIQNFFSSHGRGLCLLHNIGKVRWNKKGNCVNVVIVE